VHDRMHMWPFSKVVPTYISSKSFDSEFLLLQQEAANKSGAVSRMDVDVVDPIIFQDRSRNCYVNGLEDQR
jgi:hypothetical protein